MVSTVEPLMKIIASECLPAGLFRRRTNPSFGQAEGVEESNCIQVK